MAQGARQVMGDVVGINRAPSLRLSDASFSEALVRNEPGVRSVISRLVKTDISKLPTPQIHLSKKPLPVGIFHIPGEGRLREALVGVDAHLPRTLGNVKEIGANRGLDAVADLSLAYGFLIGAVKTAGRNLRITHLSLPADELWQPEFRSSTESVNQQTASYRFAAAVMLAKEGIDRPRLPLTPPENGLPPVIAGIFDPYSDMEVRAFQPAFSYSVGYIQRAEEGLPL